ncbi:uncharacterized protein BJ171DRAFT_482302 [Polychytrium aggregatum]|uniref:uncharacterized protein n=1 Tax=Polychytrium aggregatum TaxID=110093 RepID=UPI0022FEBD43|nr:uncharacterized protein BJ171DRAFT_482302 [Polychytrium aggregatum]KAI9190689.1 hypothetical protein BJ171DRAFT_482302 [Polychytrium aggregatum]
MTYHRPGTPYALLEAKLIDHMTPKVYEGIMELWKYSIKHSTTPLQRFQNAMTLIPQWTNEAIDKETHRISSTARFSLGGMLDHILSGYLTDLTLTSTSSPHEKVKSNKDLLKDFVHHAYIECGRHFHGCPTAVDHLASAPHSLDDKIRRYNSCEEIIRKALRSTLINMIPFEDVLIELNNMPPQPLFAAPPAPAQPAHSASEMSSVDSASIKTLTDRLERLELLLMKQALQQQPHSPRIQFPATKSPPTETEDDASVARIEVEHEDEGEPEPEHEPAPAPVPNVEDAPPACDDQVPELPVADDLVQPLTQPGTVVPEIKFVQVSNPAFRIGPPSSVAGADNSVDRTLGFNTVPTLAFFNSVQMALQSSTGLWIVIFVLIALVIHMHLRLMELESGAPSRHGYGSRKTSNGRKQWWHNGIKRVGGLWEYLADTPTAASAPTTTTSTSANASATPSTAQNTTMSSTSMSSSIVNPDDIAIPSDPTTGASAAITGPLAPYDYEEGHTMECPRTINFNGHTIHIRIWQDADCKELHLNSRDCLRILYPATPRVFHNLNAKCKRLTGIDHPRYAIVKGNIRYLNIHQLEELVAILKVELWRMMQSS